MNRTLLFILFLSLYSCSEYKTERYMKQMINQKIVIPDNLTTLYNGQDTILKWNEDSTLKLIVWHNSDDCTSCQISKIHQWNKMLAYAQKLNGKLNIYFIFAPDKKDVYNLNITLSVLKLDYPIMFDEDNTFKTANTFLPSDSRLHTFLLNEDNKIIMIGNPINNMKLQKMYMEAIQKTIAKNSSK